VPLPVVARGAVIGGGVGLVLAVARRAAGEPGGGKAVRLLKSTAEGALAGVAVGVVRDRSLRA
jgi:hypothetical protein